MGDDKKQSMNTQANSGKDDFSNKGAQMTTPNQVPSKRPDPTGPVADED